MCVGPKSVIVGRSNAVAKCLGPLSVVMSKSQRRMQAFGSPIERGKGLQTVAGPWTAGALREHVVGVDHRAWEQLPGYAAQRVERLSQQPLARITRVAGASPATRQPGDERGSKGICKEDGKIDTFP